LNVAGGHALGVHCQNLFVEARHMPLVLAAQLRVVALPLASDSGFE
jgi:hypothetical protein